jgi:hypothetical protein
MRRGLQPGSDHVVSGDLAPGPGVEVLAESGVAVSGGVHRCRHRRPTRGVRELPATRDALALESRSALQRRAAYEPPSPILNPGPVDEARHCANLHSVGRRWVACGPTGRLGSEVDAPGPLCTVGSTHGEEREQRQNRERSRSETDRCCRRRRGHGSYRAPLATWIRPLAGWPDITRLSDPAPLVRDHGGDSIASFGWCVRQVATASSPSASVGSTVSAR